METLITKQVEELTKAVLSTLDNYSFFTSKGCRNKAFEDVAFLGSWFGSGAPGNVLEENLLDICKTPDDMQQYFELMLHQIPKLPILDKYDNAEMLKIYEEKYGSVLRARAEELIEELSWELDILMHRLLMVGNKYRLKNPYEEEWKEEWEKDLLSIQERPEKAPGGAVILPDVLNTDEAKKVFQKAIEAGLMGKEDTRYKTIGKGRPKKPFKDNLIDDAEGKKLQKLHLLIDGRKGKAVSLVILASIKKGWLIEKPTFTQVKDEFGDIGTQQGFANYLDENKFTKEELEGAINSLV